MVKKKDMAAYSRFWADRPEVGAAIRKIGDKHRAETKAFKSGAAEIKRQKKKEMRKEEVEVNEQRGGSPSSGGLFSRWKEKRAVKREVQANKDHDEKLRMKFGDEHLAKVKAARANTNSPAAPADTGGALHSVRHSLSPFDRASAIAKNTEKVSQTKSLKKAFGVEAGRPKKIPHKGLGEEVTIKEGARIAGLKGAVKSVKGDVPVIGLNGLVGAGAGGLMNGGKSAAIIGGLTAAGTAIASARAGYKSGKNSYRAMKKEDIEMNEDEVEKNTDVTDQNPFQVSRAAYDAIIQGALEGNSVDVKDAVNHIMVTKAAEVVDAIKQDVAADMFGAAAPETDDEDDDDEDEWDPEEDDEDDDEDSDEDADDEVEDDDDASDEDDDDPADDTDYDDDDDEDSDDEEDAD